MKKMRRRLSIQDYEADYDHYEDDDDADDDYVNDGEDCHSEEWTMYLQSSCRLYTQL